MRTVSPRALNRATLDRQLLLRRHDRPARAAVRHLVGLQAQAPLAPYVGLWNRLSGFTAENLSTLITERSVVRAPIFRGTVHAVDSEDFLAFRPLFGKLMAGALRANFTKRLAGADPAEVSARARDLLAERGPLTRVALGEALAARWPRADPSALAYAVTYLVPVVQVPPRGIWGKSGQATWASAESWLSGTGSSGTGLSGPAVPVRRAGELVLRYLAAFGPATVADAQVWSGLTRLREITEKLDLEKLRGPDGAELLDWPDTPPPDEDVPAPPRFLPEYDNLLLSHAGRSRVNPAARQPPLWPGNGGTRGTLLIDGIWDALWEITKSGSATVSAKTVLTVSPFRSLTAAERSAVTEEGLRLLAFTSPGADSADVCFA